MNKRLLEVKVAYKLNSIVNMVNQKKKKETLMVLSCLLTSIKEDYKVIFERLLEMSCNENILGATEKELYTMFKTFYKTREAMSKAAGYTNPSSFTRVYRTYYNTEITKDYLDSLIPIFIKDEDTFTVCSILSSFFDGFKLLIGEPNYKYCDHYRSIELEFWLIYDKLISIINNGAIVDKFLVNMTTLLNIDWGTISGMLRGLLYITRNSVINNKLQFKQEIFNLYYLKGFKISDVTKYVLQTKTNYYTDNYKRITKDITKSNFEFAVTYTPTLDWTRLNKEEAMKFIEVMYSAASDIR